MTTIAIGELVVDWLSTQRGRDLNSAHEFYRVLGGNASNVAIGLRRLGNNARIVSKVGVDIHGQYLLSVLAKEGIETDFIIEDERYPTAQCYIALNNNQQEPFYYNWPKSNAAHMLSEDEIVDDIFNGAKFLHTSGISLMSEPRRSAVRKAFNMALEKGLVISFDATYPSGQGLHMKDAVEEILRKAHILKLNEAELLFWSQSDKNASLETLASLVFEKYKPVALAATASSKGSYIVTAEGCTFCPPIKVDSVCEVGAGDAFVAGLIHSLAIHLPGKKPIDEIKKLGLDVWKQAAIVGNITGALVTKSIGAFESFPHKEELEKHLVNVIGQDKNNGIEKHPLAD